MTYGCYNRAPYAAATGARYLRVNIYGDGAFVGDAYVFNRLSKTCQYTLSALGAADAGCLGCTWRRGQLPLSLWPEGEKDPNFP